MNFEERKQIASKLVVEFLDDFTAPRGLDEAKLAKRISSVADAFARRMPTGAGYEEKIERVLTNIRDTHLSNSWPPQAAFVMAMPQGERRKLAPQTYEASDDSIPKKMQSGQAVPEHEVWKNHSVEIEVLERYRFASVDRWREVHRTDAERLMKQKYGPIVCQYFLEAAE